MFRRTKIIATLGPASASAELLAQLIDAGTNVFRLNFSHWQPEHFRELVALIRKQAADKRKHLAILADLQGPKIRIGSFPDGKVTLVAGAEFVLDSHLDDKSGSQQAVGVSYARLAADCQVGDVLLLDDGLISVKVERIKKTALYCRVLSGGTLASHKGINRQGGGLTAPALTAKDRNDIALAAELEVDFLALSFPRNADDVKETRQLYQQAGGKGGIIAKIERAEAVASDAVLDAIIRSADGVMVARGDLAVEIGDAELIAVQKQVIKRARSLGRFVITATQMMESMIHSSKPTRAEVSDVANAVLDGTDAVMLSAETAVGDHPVLCVSTMAQLIAGAERSRLAGHAPQMELTPLTETDTAIAAAAMFMAYRLDKVKALVSFTTSGHTPLMMSRLRSGLPIFALTPHDQTLRRMAIVRGVTALRFTSNSASVAALEQAAIKCLTSSGQLVSGDCVLLTHGDLNAGAGGTNTIKLLTLP